MASQRIVYLNAFVLSTATSIKFNQSIYSINEDNGLLQPVVILSNPFPINVNIQVLSIENSATSKCYQLNNK